MNVTWEENVFATLDELDDAGQKRVSQLGAPEGGVVTPLDDEPQIMASGLPALEELELEIQPPRLA